MAFVKENQKAPKGMAKVCILDILREADADHPLTQDKIRRLLESRYGIALDRKTVHRQLNELAESVDAVCYTEERRTVKGEKTVTKTNFYLKSEFDEKELQMLLYTTMFSRHIPLLFKRDLLKKLGGFAVNDRQRKLANSVQPDDDLRDETDIVFLNLGVIDQAIAENRMVSFRYVQYGTDKKLHETGTEYSVSPLGIAFRNDCFYLISLPQGVEKESADRPICQIASELTALERRQGNLDAFRIDRIRGIQLLGNRRVDLSGIRKKKYPGVRGGVFNVQEFVRRNPTLEPGHAISARLKLTESSRCSLTDVIDCVGKRNVRSIVEKGRNREKRRVVEIVVGPVNDNVLRGFILKSTPSIEAIEPPELRESIREAYEEALRKMG